MTRFEPKPLGFFARLIPGARTRHAAAVAAEKADYARLTAQRREEIEKLEAEVANHNQQVDALKAGLAAGEPAAVKAYAELVLDRSPYPDNFPQEARVGFVAESNQLVVDLRVPLMNDIVPAMDRFRYVKAQDAIVGVKKPEKARQALYSSVIAQTSLRTLRE